MSGSCAQYINILLYNMPSKYNEEGIYMLKKAMELKKEVEEL